MKPTATFYLSNMPAGTRCATRRITTSARRASKMVSGLAGSARRWSGSRGELFFKLSAYQNKRARPLRASSDFVLPKERLTKSRASCAASQRPVDLTTTFDWGIPVPGDSKHIMYVWVDALTHYITALAIPTPRVRRSGRIGRPTCM